MFQIRYLISKSVVCIEGFFSICMFTICVIIRRFVDVYCDVGSRYNLTNGAGLYSHFSDLTSISIPCYNNNVFLTFSWRGFDCEQGYMMDGFLETCSCVSGLRITAASWRSGVWSSLRTAAPW